jgi:cell division transport system permease protein
VDTFRYFIRRAVRNMRQSPFLCIAAVATTALALAIVGFFAIIVFNVEQLTSRWGEEVEVIAYLDEVPEAEVLQKRIAQIEAMPEVERVKLVTRAQAFERFRERLGPHAELLDGVDPEILPASLEISPRADLRDRQGVDQLVANLEEQAGLSDLRYGHEWLAKFESFLSLVRLVGVILGGFLLFAALFIVSNTIRLTLFARREELEIMALVGATPLFIKIPFIIEGAVQGLVGGLLALTGVYLVFALFLQQGLQTVLLAAGGQQVVFLPSAYLVGLILLGLLLGIGGSLGALRKFVRI